MRKFKYLALFLSAAFFLAACSTVSDYKVSPQNRLVDYDIYNNTGDTLDSGPKEGGMLNLFSTYPDTLNPLLSNNSYVNGFSSLIFDSLVSVDKKQQPVPQLSDKWDVSADGLVWTFHIRENVKWHDDVPLTAEDVEYTFDTLFSSQTASIYKKNVQNITTFAATGDFEFRVVLSKPNSFTPQMFTFPIIPKHYYSRPEARAAPADITPIGTGRYKFVSYKKGEKIELKANRRWWGSAKADVGSPVKPYISDITIKLYEKPENAITAFQSKEIDVFSIDSIDYGKYTGRSDLKIKKFPGNKFEFMSFNLKNPILADWSVRKAISMAIDRKALANEVSGGRAVLADIPVIPGTWFNDLDNGTTAYDPAGARALLLANGWKDINGVLYKRINGLMKPLKFNLLVNDDNELRLEAAALLSQQTAAAGINLEVVPAKWEDELKKLAESKFDIAIVGSLSPSVPDISGIYSYEYLAALLPPGITAVRNISGYTNPEVDRYIGKIFNENDPDRKKAYFINLKQILDEDLPYVGLYFYNNAVLFNKRIRGELDPYFWDKYNAIEQWYLPEG